mmetsp:Transcript_26162/g.60442  ORF Transcript_26162/g.60442 Transcript_26162/m.60442 type:complete len:84 (+) Transcript_26162:491-742(+)
MPETAIRAKSTALTILAHDPPWSVSRAFLIVAGSAAALWGMWGSFAPRPCLGGLRSRLHAGTRTSAFNHTVFDSHLFLLGFGA